MVDLKLEKKEEDWFFYIHEKRNSQEIEKKLFYKIQKNREKKIIPSNRRISSPTYSKSERRLAPPKSVGSKSASHEKRIQVRASLAENKKALLLCGPSYGIYLMIKNITVMWISLLLLKKELKKFVIVYFFDVVSVKEPKNLEKMPKNVVCDRQFFKISVKSNSTRLFFVFLFALYFFGTFFFTKNIFCWAYSMQYYNTTIQKKKKIALFFSI